MTLPKLKFLACVMACPVAYAGVMGEPSKYLKGITFVGGAGETGFNNVGNYTATAGSLTTNSNVRTYQYGFMGNLAIGYNRPINQLLYFGGEFGVNFFGTRKAASQSSASNSAIVYDVSITPGDPPISEVHLNNNMSTRTTVSSNVVVPYFDIKPGIFVHESTLLFARLGVDYNQLTVTTKSNYNSRGEQYGSGNLESTRQSNVDLASTAKKQVAGLRTGLGLEYFLNDNIGLSTHYVYAFYNTFNTNALDANSDVVCDVFEGCAVSSDGNYTAIGSSKVGSQQVLLELNYHMT